MLHLILDCLKTFGPQDIGAIAIPTSHPFGWSSDLAFAWLDHGFTVVQVFLSSAADQPMQACGSMRPRTRYASYGTTYS